jgi:hypothetical protein
MEGHKISVSGINKNIILISKRVGIKMLICDPGGIKIDRQMH